MFRSLNRPCGGLPLHKKRLPAKNRQPFLLGIKKATIVAFDVSCR